MMKLMKTLLSVELNLIGSLQGKSVSLRPERDRLRAAPQLLVFIILHPLHLHLRPPHGRPRQVLADGQERGHRPAVAVVHHLAHRHRGVVDVPRPEELGSVPHRAAGRHREAGGREGGVQEGQGGAGGAGGGRAGEAGQAEGRDPDAARKPQRHQPHAGGVSSGEPRLAGERQRPAGEHRGAASDGGEPHRSDRPAGRSDRRSGAERDTGRPRDRGLRQSEGGRREPDVSRSESEPSLRVQKAVPGQKASEVYTGGLGGSSADPAEAEPPHTDPLFGRRAPLWYSCADAARLQRSASHNLRTR